MEFLKKRPMILFTIALCLTLIEAGPSDECESALTECSRRSLTHGPCGNSLYRMQLEAIRHDVNRDFFITADDFEIYAMKFLDPDNDDIICRDEFINITSGYYGYSKGMVNDLWERVYGEDEDCIAVNDTYRGSGHDLIGAYISDRVEKLALYCMQPPNLRDDVVSCSVIVNLCKYSYGNLAGCSDFLAQEDPPVEHRKSLLDKINVHILELDYNRDGKVTLEEFHNFDIQIDAQGNNSGCVEWSEGLDYWLSTYNYTVKFIRAVWDQLPDLNNNNCVDPSDWDERIPEEGVPKATLYGSEFSGLLSLCQEDPSGDIYSVNMDCAEASYACRQWFPNHPSCQAYTQCGLQAYAKCAQGLLSSKCSAAEDQQYINAEVAIVNTLDVDEIMRLIEAAS